MLLGNKNEDQLIMETVERVFNSVREENKKTDKLVRNSNPLVFNNDENHNNRLMDMINECKGVVNDINDAYERLFVILQEIYEVDYKKLDSKDSSFLNKLIAGLNKMNTQISRFFSELSREEALRQGCKSDLMDLRINIRSMRETISDIEYKLVSSDEETDKLIDDLLSQF